MAKGLRKRERPARSSLKFLLSPPQSLRNQKIARTSRADKMENVRSVADSAWTMSVHASNGSSVSSRTVLTDLVANGAKGTDVGISFFKNP